ncbi:unnamed protein product [Dibothriocephalus latus]|uniref:Uncharacterized protein n=1 Tax=Dibothriocephalus latus TaxID=60516 RepID=A0A3P6Q375_DIBLA|nr:unnamed protein product [Dibothriocephalus latus]
MSTLGSEPTSHGPDTPTSSVTGNSFTLEGGNNPVEKPAPVFLPVGAAVSAKYRGAFCEALIERVELNFRLRVQLKKSKASFQP